MFWPVVYYGWVHYDDVGTILQNPLVTEAGAGDPWRILTWFSARSWYPARLACFALEYAVFGENPAGYHAVGAALHLANILLFYALAKRLAEISGADSARAATGAFLAALVMGFHPSVADVTAWIPGREELLMFFFLLLSLHFYLSARQHPEKELRFLLPCAFFCACSCLSNIYGVLIPALVVVYDLSLGGIRRVGPILSHTWFLWALAASAVFIKVLSLGNSDLSQQVLLYPNVWDALAHWPELAGQSGLAGALGGPVSRPALALGLLFKNLFHLVAPYRLPVLYPWPSEITWAGLPVILGGAAVCGMAVAAWFWRKKPLFLFGLMWLAIGLLPSLHLMPHQIYQSERFLYLPLAGFALLAGHGAAGSSFRVRLAVLAYVLFLGVWLVTYLPSWADGLALWTRAAGHNPTESRPWRELARVYERDNQFGEARKWYEQALLYSPGDPVLWKGALGSMVRLGQVQDAEKLAREAAALMPEDPYRHWDLAWVLEVSGKPEQARAARDLAMERMGDHPGLALEAARTCLVENRPQKARELLEGVLLAQPKNALAHYWLAVALDNQGDGDRARRHYQKTLEFAPMPFDPDILETAAQRAGMNKN